MKKLIILAVLTFIFAFPVMNVNASTSANDVDSPEEEVDCGIWAYDPVHVGSNVQGTGLVSCATAHPSLRVVAGIRDSKGHYNSVEKRCYNASNCSVTATLPYISEIFWKADASGYVGTWNAYYVTDWEFIPY